MAHLDIAAAGVCIQIHHLEIVERLDVNLRCGRSTTIRRKTRTRTKTRSKVHLALRRGCNLVLICKEAHSEVITELHNIVAATDVDFLGTRSKRGQLRNGGLGTTIDKLYTHIVALTTEL